MTFLSKTLAAIAVLFSFSAIAETTITFDDGTVVYLEPEQKVYVSVHKVYELVELEPVVGGESSEPEPQGSEEWCEWYLEQNDGVVAPSFDEGYTIYVRNCQ